ncbi:MAG TPA: L-lactate permease [Anditalea sp.]|nr:L-lactate permease [Anditalea sp.]
MALLHFIIPFGILIIFTVGLRKPLWLAALISYLASFGLFMWQGDPASELFKGIAMGFFVALEISFIIIGAIFFLNFLKGNGIIDQINSELKNVTTNKILQVFLLAWLFGSFIEGSAGFGTPALIVAPLLAALGFPLLLAVAIPLLANTTGVAFGAVGTAIKIGFAGIDIPHIATTAALLNLCTGFIVPLLLAWILYKYHLKEEGKNVTGYLVFAVWAGVALTLPSWLISYMGPEFPTLIGAMIGLFIVIISIKYRFLLPKGETESLNINLKGLLNSFMPYIGLSILLIIGRLVFQMRHINIHLWDGLSKKLYIFQPGMAFFIMPLILLFFFKNQFKWQSVSPSLHTAMKAAPRPAFAILFLAAIAQNLVLSNQSFLSPFLPQMPIELAVFLTPFFGALGSFAAGSATVSNLIFGQEINFVSSLIDVDNNLMLSLQLLGAAIGNAVALQNIAVVQAAILMHGKEKDLLKILVMPVLLYLVVVGITGVLFYYMVG